MKTLSKILVCTFMILAGLNSAKAQDIHFSQFYNSPLNLNPALTGVMNCKTRFVANYRNQWASVLKANAYNTYSASYDQKVPVGREDYFGIGGTLWGDVAGESRFGTTQGKISLSYSKKMAGYRKKSSYLVLGVDGGMTQRRISNTDLRWPNQITSNGFEPGLPNGEANFNDFDFLFADLGAGLLWFSVIDEKTNYYVGAALAHLNQPDVSFLGEVESLYTRATIHAGAQFEIQPKISLLPYIVYMAQGEHVEFNAGTSVRFALGPSRLSNQSWQVGGWYRLGTKEDGGIHSDAVILSTRFDYENFGLGFSYDINVSQLSSAGTANGSFEFSLVYLICGPENRGVYCPRF